MQSWMINSLDVLVIYAEERSVSWEIGKFQAMMLALPGRWGNPKYLYCLVIHIILTGTKVFLTYCGGNS